MRERTSICIPCKKASLCVGVSVCRDCHASVFPWMACQNSVCVCMFDRQAHGSGICDALAYRCCKFSKQTGEAREQEEGREETGTVRVLLLCLVQHVLMLIKFQFPRVAHLQKCLLCNTYAHASSSMTGRCA